MSSSNESKPENYLVNARICQLVEQCPFMYDRSHLQYLKKDVCDEAWMNIAKEMGESVSTCRERWRNIRTSFARSININKIPCSANRTKPYYLHEELKFLARHITPGVPVTRRYKKKATSGSGEESELIEVSVGEDTFNGFEHMDGYGDHDTDTQNGHDTRWRHLEKHAHGHGSDSGGCGAAGEESVNGGEVAGGGVTGGDAVDSESRCSSYAEDNLAAVSRKIHSSKTEAEADHNEATCNRLAQLPPPPLQAAPHTAFQRGSDETEAAAALQQIHMSSTPICVPINKRARLDISANGDISSVNYLSEHQNQQQQQQQQHHHHHHLNHQQPQEEQEQQQQTEHPHSSLATQTSDEEFKPSASVYEASNADTAFLQELQIEMRGMDRRQKIYFKRRVYEALSEICPLPSADVTATPITTTTTAAIEAANGIPVDIPPCNDSTTMTNVQTMATALHRLEKILRNFEGGLVSTPSVNSTSSAVSVENMNGIAKSGSSSSFLDGTKPPTAGSCTSTIVPAAAFVAAVKRHNGVTRSKRSSRPLGAETIAVTRSTTSERRKLIAHSQQDASAVKDEPEVIEYRE